MSVLEYPAVDMQHEIQTRSALPPPLKLRTDNTVRHFLDLRKDGLTDVMTSWRNLNGGLFSSLSVRGGFFTILPRVSWVFFATFSFMIQRLLAQNLTEKDFLTILWMLLDTLPQCTVFLVQCKEREAEKCMIFSVFAFHVDGILSQNALCFRCRPDDQQQGARDSPRCHHKFLGLIGRAL